MKRTVTSLLILVSILFASTADAAVSVKGYYRKNGTYVAPHYRSNPDGNPYNNWSFPGNTNPYTGKTATGDPDTYLDNYYNRGSTYTPSISVPSYYSNPTYSSPTWKSCIEFGLGASYNSLSGKCECDYGYSVRNNQCVSDSDACKQDYGYNARSTFGGKCECGYGYKFNHSGSKCISNDEYCRELDFNAEYDILENSCVCRTGYKTGISGTSCILNSNGSSFYKTPTYNPVNLNYVCPPHSKSDPLDPSSCPCDPGYKVSTDKSACILDSKSSVTTSSSCGPNMHENRGGCECDAGYGWSAGYTGCVFQGCPAGYSLNSVNECEVRPSTLTKGIACISKNPCKCPSGYEAFGNRKCVPK